MVRALHAFLAEEQHTNSDGFPTIPQTQTFSTNVSTSIFSDAYLPLTCQRIMVSHPFSFSFSHGQNPLDFSFPLFLFQLSFVIIVIHMVRFLLKPFHQPRIVSEVIGGIIIGPSVLGRNKKFAAVVFPENAKLAVKNLGVMGFMFFLFVSGVKMDLSVVCSAGRKHAITALFGVLVPLFSTLVAAVVIRDYFDWRLEKISAIGAITSSLAITAFPVLYPVLKELNLLSSDIGRQALSTAIISDIIGLNAIIAFEAMKQGEASGLASLWYLISTAVILLVILVGARRLMIWIAGQMPEGKPVDQLYTVGIFLGAMVIGFFTDLFGIAIANGPLWLGLAIPDGPPLGAAVVERCETIVMEILLPVSYTFVGLYTDLFAMGGVLSSLIPLLVVALVGYVTKWVAYVVTALFFKMTLKDSITLGLIMGLRGQVEYVLFIHWMDKEILEVPGFTMMVLLTTVVTGLSTPLISALYNPARPYIINKRRTIQHHPPNTEFRLLACIHDEDSVAGIVNLLEVSSPTAAAPFAVSALRLVELVGRASPLFIDHGKHDPSPFYTRDNPIHNALCRYQRAKERGVQIHSFTAVAPRRTAYQDICELALAAKAVLVVLPFRKDECAEVVTPALVRNVCENAPCSVGILVDRGRFRMATGAGPARRYRLAVLFLGGADAREALAYADRMLGNLDVEVSVAVVRFLSHNHEGDDEMEKKLDDGVVTWFWVKNEGNGGMVYREVVVRDGDETIAAIRGMYGEEYDLWVVGRNQGINPVLLQGLSSWSENPELGIVGDFVSSLDFKSSGSVLVVQQQIMRTHSTQTFKCNFFR